jgi:hypothetical protein
MKIRSLQPRLKLRHTDATPAAYRHWPFDLFDLILVRLVRYGYNGHEVMAL